MKKIFTLLILLLLLPVTALAADMNTVYVGGVELAGSSTSIAYATTNENGEVITEGATADNYNIKWDGNTLTLKGTYITKEVSTPGLSSPVEGAAIGVYNQSGDANLTITLEGTNTIKDVSAAIHVFAPSGSASLTITGDGILSASSGYNPGIRVQSNTGNGTLAITGAKVTASSSYSGNGVQIRCGDSSNASLTVNGGSLTATGSGATFAGIIMQFGSSTSGSGTPTVTVSDNAIVRANGSAGGITSNSSAEVQTAAGTGESGGIVFDNGTGTVYGDVELQEDITIGEGESLTIGQDASLNTGSHEVIVNGGTLNGADKITGTVKYAPVITTESLPDGTVGKSYSDTSLAATGDTPITWRVSNGSLPAGLSLSEDGKITGTPTTEGTSTFTITATNTTGSDSKEFSLTIKPVPVTGVKLDKTELSLYTGESALLNATVEPDNATNKNVTWESSNPDVATVADGVVTAVKEGEATITVTTEDGSNTAICKVKVTQSTYSITSDIMALDFGSTYIGYTQPTAQTVTITNTGNRPQTLDQPTSTTNFVVGTLSKMELAAGEGATFTVQPKAGLAVGTYSENITVSSSEGATVTIPTSFTVLGVTNIIINKSELILYIGDNETLTATIEPIEAAGQTVTWKSSNETIATVDANGKVTAVYAGEATITATVGDKTAICEVKVRKPAEVGSTSSTNLSLTTDRDEFALTAIVYGENLDRDKAKWTWSVADADVVALSGLPTWRSHSYSINRQTFTIKGTGTTTITATYDDGIYRGSVDFTVRISKPTPPDPISYYNIYVEDVCDGVEVTLSNNVVREGNSISVYVKKDTANYTFDNFHVYYKEGYYDSWDELKEGTQPGEYPIKNIWTHIYIKALGAEEKEDPTGIESIEGVKVYTKDGSLYVQTPQREQVIIVSMSGAVVKNEEQVGLKQYHGLQPGIYIVRVGDRAYKLRLN
jgi:uncharacterized protein YjdB